MFKALAQAASRSLTCCAFGRFSLTIRYKIHLCVLVSVDQNNITRRLAQALLAHEGTENFEFVFKSVLALCDEITPRVRYSSNTLGGVGWTHVRDTRRNITSTTSPAPFPILLFALVMFPTDLSAHERWLPASFTPLVPAFSSFDLGHLHRRGKGGHCCDSIGISSHRAQILYFSYDPKH